MEIQPPPPNKAGYIREVYTEFFLYPCTAERDPVRLGREKKGADEREWC